MEYEFGYTNGEASLFANLQRFYKHNGHKGRVLPNDQCMWFSLENKIIAGVRLTPLTEATDNFWLLKGLWVARKMRGQGIGGQLLQRLSTHLKPGERCYCFAYAYLRSFYEQHGYVATKKQDSPISLWQQSQRYQVRGNDLLLMHYQPDAEEQPTASV